MPRGARRRFGTGCWKPRVSLARTPLAGWLGHTRPPPGRSNRLSLYEVSTPRPTSPQASSSYRTAYAQRKPAYCPGPPCRSRANRHRVPEHQRARQGEERVPPKVHPSGNFVRHSSQSGLAVLTRLRVGFGRREGTASISALIAARSANRPGSAPTDQSWQPPSVRLKTDGGGTGGQSRGPGPRQRPRQRRGGEGGPIFPALAAPGQRNGRIGCTAHP